MVNISSIDINNSAASFLEPESKPELIIHLGYPKAASKLLEKRLYPFIKRGNLIGSNSAASTKLAAFLNAKSDTQKQTLQDLFKEKVLKDKLNIVVSPQSLSLNTQDVEALFLKLDSLKADYNIKLVIGVRNQAHLLFSYHYKNLAKNKSTAKFKEKFSQLTIPKQALNYSRVYEIAQKYFSKEDIHIFMQERLAEDPLYESMRLIDFINPDKAMETLQHIEQGLFDKINAQSNKEEYLSARSSILDENSPEMKKIASIFKKSNQEFQQQSHQPVLLYRYTDDPVTDSTICPAQDFRSWKRNVTPYFNKLVDKVYLINLDKDLDRLKTFEGHLKDIGGLDFERIPAVYGRAIQSSMAKGIGAYQTSFKPGAVGCALSHMLVYEDALNKGYDKILVLEDDARFKPYADRVVNEALKQLPDDWDILYLGYLQVRPSREKLSPFLEKVMARLTTHGYLISRKGLLKLYAALESSFLRNGHFKDIDVFIRDYELSQNLVTYAVRPKAMYCTSNMSSIRNYERDYGQRCQVDMVYEVNAFAKDNFIPE